MIPPVLIGGVRSDVAVKIYGDDLDQLAATGQRIAALLKKIPGAVDTRVAQTSGFPTFDIEFDRVAIARHGLTQRFVVEHAAGDQRSFDAAIVRHTQQRSDL